MTAIENLQRVIGLRGTKAQVEALTATLEEQAIAVATDKNQIGIYTNGSWTWFDAIVKVSSNDTTPGYLNGKLLAGMNITITEGSDGGNETLTIATRGSGEHLVEDGSSAPPVTLTNETEDDWLYEG